uniref:Protein kinase domain-containing protein n=1 Tax=Leersia perrieri TaxID=77586 RepID=A0A0D9XT62_9ORYZ
MHSSATGVVVHGCVTPFNILLDDNFMSKVSDFSMSRNLTMRNGYDIKSTLPTEVKMQHYSDSGWTRFPTVDGDVYSFGVLLMDLIIRKPIFLHDINFVTEFREYYMGGNIPRAFDMEITTEGDVAILEEIGRLAVRCTDEEHAARPTMEEVAQVLKRMELPESKLRDFIQSDDKAKWRADNNHNIMRFTGDEIKRITNNYSTVIGKGGFGQVYKGVLDDNRVVAVKKYIIEQNSALMVVTEFISKGSLHDILHQSDASISLDTRLRIAIQCAEALGYMHSSMYTLLIHGDIKLANILLDDSFNAKISDFGISRFLAGDDTRYTINVKGSIDYMDPILLRDGRLTPKNDIYSFGAVLLELITRKRIKEEGKFSLIGSFTEDNSKGKWMKDLFYADIACDSNLKIINEIAKLATEWLTLDMNKRPMMNVVAERLWKLREYHNGGHEKTTFWRSFWGTQDLFEQEKQCTSSASHVSSKNPKKKSFAIFKWNMVQLSTIEELEDNTLVTVKKPCHEDEGLKYCFVNEMMILCQISHNNIIKLLGCCLEPDIPILVYEYSAKGSLSDILRRDYGHREYGYFSLALHLKIASETAKALAKVSCFFASRSITKESDQIVPILLRMLSCTDPVYLRTGLATIKSDVYSFGVILMALIIGRMPTYDQEFVAEFTKVYETGDSGGKMFDPFIRGEDDMAVLEEMGRLAVRCVGAEDGRPAMAEVFNILFGLRALSCWRKLEFLENMCAAKEITDNKNIDGIRNFSEDEIETITSGYSTLIGKGGFGEVYRGVLDNDDLVAVKRYIRGDLIQEFMEEVRIHSQIDHKNVVKLIGYCRGENTLVMVTEYISQGNLEDILHNRKVAMPLDTRLGIAIGCAKALNYMHSMHLSTDSLVCHGDIKPANILLDDNLTAKLSDFGVSRLLLGGTTRHTVNVKGSIDYMDPMYRRDGCLTSKNDVYSFGIVLMELISRKRVNEGKTSLIYTFEAFFQGIVPLMEVFDGEIVNEGNLEALESIGKLANKCADWNIKNRPKMSMVVEQLLKLWIGLRGRQGFLKMSLSAFKRIALNSTIQTKLQDVKVEVFSAEKLISVTQNYSCLLGKDPIRACYKGTLEDNSLVAVVKHLYGFHSSDGFIYAVMRTPQIVHKNIIKLLGYCLEGYHPIFVFEYAFASKRHLEYILHGSKDHLPLELRLNIAVQTAHALAYIQSPSTEVGHHDSVVPSDILLDDNFTPKVTGYWPLLKRYGMFRDSSEPEPWSGPYDVYMDPKSSLVKSDVYRFGIILMELISRKKPVYDKGSRLIDKFRTENSRREIFDKDILSEDSFVVLEGIGQLAVKCTSKLVDKRPTMQQVAEYLEITRRHWKKHIVESARTATSCSEAEAAIAIGISGDEATEFDRPLSYCP